MRPPGWVEPLILYVLFFFQGFLGGGASITGSAFDDPLFIAATLLTALPPSALVWYLLFSTASEPLRSFGLGFKAMDLLRALPVYLGVIIPLGVATAMINLMPLGDDVVRPIQWSLKSPGLLGFAALAFVATSYFEELFFRSYLLTRFRTLGLRPMQALLVSALMFSAGHIYEGVGGLAVSFCLGVYFGWVFQRFGRVWPLVLAHAAYNITVLTVSMIL